MPASPASRIWRAAKVGLAAGALIAGLILGVGAVMFFRFECAPPRLEACVSEECAPEVGTPQCESDVTLAHDIARIEALAAVGLALVGVGLVLSLRQAKTDPAA